MPLPTVEELGPRFAEFVAGLKRPLIFFDTETTGTDPANDRVVEISMIKISPSEGLGAPRTWRINPGVRIPLEASEIHGIYNKDVAQEPHFAQAADELLAFLAGANLGRIALEKIAWRMKDRDAFTRVLALLDERHAYSDRLWAYGLLHADAPRVAQWLRHQDAFVRLAGPSLAGAVIDLDPIARGWYEHLEYAPLINARAHQLGKRRMILNLSLIHI